MTSESLQPHDALILVDVQKDFCPGGALPVSECRRMIPVLNGWIEAAQAAGSRLVASRDWHPADHFSFQERGGPWPVHCVKGTSGAEFCAELAIPPETEIVSKGTGTDRDSYSAFDGTGLAERLKEGGIRRVFVGGLALDVCVRATVLDALEAGFDAHLIREGTRPIDEAAGERAIEEMRAAGAVID